MELPKMRTINEIVDEIKIADPKSAISYNFVRKLCMENKLKYIMAGNRYLIDIDCFLSYISG